MASCSLIITSGARRAERVLLWFKGEISVCASRPDPTRPDPTRPHDAFERLISLERVDRFTSGLLCSMSPFNKFRIWPTPIPAGACHGTWQAPAGIGVGQMRNLLNGHIEQRRPLVTVGDLGWPQILRSPEVTNCHLPITFDQKDIETWDWCQYVCLGQANRLICSMTHFGHYVTLAWLNLRSNFDLDLSKPLYIWFDAP